MGFRLGKIPSRLLESHVLSQLGSRSSAVVVGPAIGEDSAVLRLSSPLLAAKSDPVTGAAHNAGKLVVHVNANDLAASGALPQFFLLTALFPEGSPVELAQSLQKQVHEACLSLGVSIVGGHTEMTDAVSRPVLVGCMLGPLITREPIKTAGARPGDLLVLTKGVAIEAVSILLADRAEQLKHLFGGSLEGVKRISDRFGEMLSVVPDARVALGSVPEGTISSMHDPTEGGLAGALHEVADAADKGFEIDEEAVACIVSREAGVLAKHYGVSPLELVSSGALLLCASPPNAPALVRGLKEAGIFSSVIGRVTPSGRTLRSKDGRSRDLPRPEQDALWTCLANKN